MIQGDQKMQNLVAFEKFCFELKYTLFVIEIVIFPCTPGFFYSCYLTVTFQAFNTKVIVFIASSIVTASTAAQMIN